MNIEELENRLFALTPSERFHLEHPGMRSKRYDRIATVRRNGKELYVFRFDTIMNKHNIALHKESRFAAVPPHIHTVIEIMYVYRGSCTQIVNGERITLHTGDVSLIDADASHEILPLTDEDIVITLDIRKQFFTDGFLARMSSQGTVARFLLDSLTRRQKADRYLTFRKQQDIETTPVIQQLLCEYYEPNVCSEEIIDSYMIILFSQLLRIYQKQTARISSRDSDSSLPALILSYMEDNCTTATLRSTAQAFGFHPNYLSVYIRRHTGKTFKDLLIGYRMVLGASYLCNTDIPVTTIAHELGYANLTFFYDRFRRTYGLTPQEYRERNTMS